MPGIFHFPGLPEARAAINPLGTFIYDNSRGQVPDMVFVANNIYVITYQGNPNKLATVRIQSPWGSSNMQLLHTASFATDNDNAPSVIKISSGASSSVFAAVYTESGKKGSIKTFSVNHSTGAISIIQTKQFESQTAVTPKIIWVSGNIYAIVYEGDSADGFVRTVSITSSGVIDTNITNGLFEFDTTNGKNPDIIPIANDIYAIAYSGSADRGRIVTVRISGTGSIQQSLVGGPFQFDNTGITPELVKVFGSTNVYAVVYEASGTDGTIKTLTINSTGTSIGPIIQTFVFESDDARTPDVVHLGADVYGIVYEGDASDGYIVTVSINSTGTSMAIFDPVLEFDTVTTFNPIIRHLSGTIYAVVYESNGQKGTIKTFDLDITPPPLPVSDIKANGSDGPISLPFGGSATISWTSSDATSCSVSPCPPGPPNPGSCTDLNNAGRGTGSLTSSQTYTLTCTGPGGTVPDSVTINVAPPPQCSDKKDNDGDTLIDYPDDPGCASAADDNEKDDPPPPVVSVDCGLRFSDGITTTRVACEPISSGAFPGLNTFIYDSARGINPDIIHVSGDVYAVAYTQDGDDGFLKTVTITPTGDIGPVIGTLEFDTSHGVDPDIIHVSGDVFAIAYTGPGDDGFIKTVNITPAGSIGAVIGTLEFDPIDGKTPHIINVSGTVYAIVYETNAGDGQLITINIPNSGTPITSIDSYEFDDRDGKTPRIIHVSGNIYAIAYEGQNTDGFVVTVTISPSGTITKSLISSFEFEDSVARTPDILKVAGEYYAIAYAGPSADAGWVKTVRITSAGTIIGTVDSLRYDSQKGSWPDIIHTTGDLYAIAYIGGASNGWLTTITINSSGDIGNSVVNTYEFYPNDIGPPVLQKLSNGVFAVVYEGLGNDGFIKTFGIGSPSTTPSALRLSNNGATYGVILVPTTDPDASKVRIWTTSGVRSLKRF